MLIGGVVAVLLLAAFVGSSLYTDRSQFCSTCHEMVPYGAAWGDGQHADNAQCVDCHVDAGLPARLSHKFVALKEVYEHFAGDTKFPRPAAPDVPSERCVRCHPDVPDTLSNGFPHAEHAKKGTCAECHFDAGHSVSTQALKDAGVYAAGVTPQRLRTELAVVGGGSANLPGHPSVSCSRCHDMKKVPCSACHRVPAKGHPDTNGEECSRCHRAGASFAFKHPSAGEHDWRKIPCAKCHPSGYSSAYCSCHGGNPPKGD